MQTTIVAIIITLSIVYICKRIFQLMNATNDPCSSCQGCALKELRRKNGENRHCTNKKPYKNLVKQKNSSTFASANRKGCLG